MSKNVKHLVFKELRKIAYSTPLEQYKQKDLYNQFLQYSLPEYKAGTVKRHISEFMKYHYGKDIKPAVMPETPQKRNVLIIGDTHLPAEHKDALKMLKRAYIDYNITDVIHIGDVIDNHAMSYHESDPDGMSSGDELEETKKRLQDWYKAFPNMIITEGNHGALPKRKLFTAGIPKAFMRSLNEVLNVPTWKFVESHTIGNVFFSHGIGMDAKARVRALGMSCVAGHHHGKKYIEYVDHHHGTFAMQVGCLVDKHNYAMAYGKHSVLALGSGVILDIENNPTPILLNM